MVPENERNFLIKETNVLPNEDFISKKKIFHCDFIMLTFDIYINKIT